MRAMDYEGILAQVLADIEPQIGRGQVATHIPALGSVDPNQFGMAVADLDGNVTGVGAFESPFSAQSVTKVFALALVIASESATSGAGSAASRRAAPTTRWSSSRSRTASLATRSSMPARSSRPTVC